MDQVKVTVNQVKRGRENLVIKRLRMDGDTCRDHGRGVADTLLQVRFSGLDLKTIGRRFVEFGPQNSEGVQGSTCRHRRVCVEAKLSCVGLVAFGSHIFTWIILPLGLSDSAKISKVKFRII